MERAINLRVRFNCRNRKGCLMSKSRGFLARFFGSLQEAVPEEVKVKQRLTSQINNALSAALKEIVGSYEYYIEDTDLEKKFVVYYVFSTGKYFKREYTMDANGTVTLSDTAVEVTLAPPQWVEVKTTTTAVEPEPETITATEETVVSENKPCTCGAAIAATAESETPTVTTTTPDVEAITPEELQLVRDILARERAGENERRQKAASVVAKATGVKTENLDNVPTSELEVLAKSLVATRYGAVSVSTEPVASAWDTPKKEAN